MTFLTEMHKIGIEMKHPLRHKMTNKLSERSYDVRTGFSGCGTDDRKRRKRRPWQTRYMSH